MSNRVVVVLYRHAHNLPYYFSIPVNKIYIFLFICTDYLKNVYITKMIKEVNIKHNIKNEYTHLH